MILLDELIVFTLEPRPPYRAHHDRERIIWRRAIAADFSNTHAIRLVPALLKAALIDRDCSDRLTRAAGSGCGILAILRAGSIVVELDGLSEVERRLSMAPAAAIR